MTVEQWRDLQTLITQAYYEVNAEVGVPDYLEHDMATISDAKRAVDNVIEWKRQSADVCQVCAWPEPAHSIDGQPVCGDCFENHLRRVPHPLRT